MGNVIMEATQINYRRDDTLKTVDQKLQELSQESAIDTDIAPVFKSTSAYNPGDLVYYRNKLYKCTNQHTGAWAAGDFTATDVSTALNTAAGTLNNIKADYVDIAPSFDSTASYTAGDLVEYQGIIYRCTNDHTGDWDADDFSATTIAAEIHEVNSNLTNVVDCIGWDKRVNLFDVDHTIINADKGVDSESGELVDNNYYSTTDYITVNSNTDYYVFGDTDNPGGAIIIAEYASGNVFIERKTISGRTGNTIKGTFKTNSNTKFIRIGLPKEGAGLSAKFDTVQLQYGTTGTEYEPYHPVIGPAVEELNSKQMVKTSENVTLNSNGQARLSITLTNARIVYCVALENNDTLLALPYVTNDGYWAVKVADPTDMSAYASATVNIAYGYIPN